MISAPADLGTIADQSAPKPGAIAAIAGDPRGALLAELDHPGAGRTTDFSRKARVYYGDVSLHEYLERTTWHSAQHVRQLVMVLGTLGIEPDRPPASETFAGLPMPDKVWDDEPQPIRY